MRLGSEYSRDFWTVVGLLLVAVAAPTACVLWFMSEALANERLAMRQRLDDLYQRDLLRAGEAVQAFWGWREREAQAARRLAAPLAFHKWITSGLGDSALIFDSSGRLRYPAPVAPTVPHPMTESPPWRAAQALEFAAQQPGQAARGYVQIANQHSTDTTATALALQAQARALAKAGQTSASLNVLLRFTEPSLMAVRDAGGRLIAPDAQLQLLRLRKASGQLASPQAQAMAQTLSARLRSYEPPQFPAPQRLFLLRELDALFPNPDLKRLITAEALAADVLGASTFNAPRHAGLSELPGHPALLAWTSQDGFMLSLFQRAPLMTELDAIIRRTVSLPGVRLMVQPEDDRAHAGGQPKDEGKADAAMTLTRSLAPAMPGWRLTLQLTAPDPSAALARRRHLLYLWTAALVILGTFALALLLAGALRRQLRLTRLKNDFIATVTHELKTPLASMRVLVETLREGCIADPAQQREYLDLIARENTRLSRLIDNFLTFSRMERNKHAFDLRPLRPGEVASEAAEALRERFESAGAQFTLELAQPLPFISGDRDALVTVLINLLDNALKYSGEQKEITLAARRLGDHLAFEVRDNGLGIAPRDQRHIFERFFQVDRSLSRTAGGCGLGLSIVRFIVQAHAGRMQIESTPGRGSTFRVLLPIDQEELAD